MITSFTMTFNYSR